ncbi:MAG: FHIPEP family type III secretion protein, partial [Leptospiraceae bacterium]|nr:FHIPEP family type III secretion protein [Leptospiraceae bacterium]
LLTIGDGLVAQIPSLLITSATGMVVARAGALDSLSSELSDQLFRNSRVMYLTGGALFFASLIPGFPKFSLWLLSGLLIGLGYYMSRQDDVKIEREKAESSAPKPSNPTETVLDEYSLDKIKLEVGINLLNIAQNNLVERITNLRRKLAKENGILVPPVRVADNINDLQPDEYSILIGGTEVLRGKADPVRLVAIHTPNVSEEIQGDEFIDPSFDVKAYLIQPSQKAEAESKGYIVVDAATVIITSLSEVIRQHVTQIMGREEVKMLIDKVKERYPTVVQEAQEKAGMGLITALLQNLVRENVAIRNIQTILETLIAHIDRTKDVSILTEYVRQNIGRQIAAQYIEGGKIPVIQIDPAIEDALRQSITYDERDGRIFALDPATQQEIRNLLVASYNRVQANKLFPVFVTGSEVRAGIFAILEREAKNRSFAVLGYEELPADIQFDIVDQVVLETNEVNADGVR